MGKKSWRDFVENFKSGNSKRILKKLQLKETINYFLNKVGSVQFCSCWAQDLIEKYCAR